MVPGESPTNALSPAWTALGKTGPVDRKAARKEGQARGMAYSTSLVLFVVKRNDLVAIQNGSISETQD